MTYPQMMSNRLTIDGVETYVTPGQHKLVILFILAVPGRQFTNEELLTAVYPNPFLEPDEAWKVITVYIHHLRKKGFPIRLYGKRYYLATPQLKYQDNVIPFPIKGRLRDSFRYTGDRMVHDRC